jgi:hypothetical protein
VKLPWSKVEPGMRVSIKGRDWGVRSIEKGKKKARVTLSTMGAPNFSGEVRLKDEVEVARKSPLAEKLKPEPVQRETKRGMQQQRWATEMEASRTLEPGDPEQTKPPKKAKGSPWDTPQDQVEQRVADLLSASLVAESKDTAAGYYVPPQTVETIKAHLLVFHDGADLTRPEAELLEWHREQHAISKGDGNGHKVNHWHTEHRPR